MNEDGDLGCEILISGTHMSESRAGGGIMGKTNALQLVITLVGSEPPIWRRVIVPERMTFADLHRVIQFSMGWRNSHLHHFEVADKR